MFCFMCKQVNNYSEMVLLSDIVNREHLCLLLSGMSPSAVPLFCASCPQNTRSAQERGALYAATTSGQALLRSASHWRRKQVRSCATEHSGIGQAVTLEAYVIRSTQDVKKKTRRSHYEFVMRRSTRLYGLARLEILDHSFEVRSPIGDLQILLQTYLLYLLHICYISVYLLYLVHICYICCISAISAV